MPNAAFTSSGGLEFNLQGASMAPPGLKPCRSTLSGADPLRRLEFQPELAVAPDLGVEGPRVEQVAELSDEHHRKSEVPEVNVGTRVLRPSVPRGERSLKTVLLTNTMNEKPSAPVGLSDRQTPAHARVSEPMFASKARAVSPLTGCPGDTELRLLDIAARLQVGTAVCETRER